MLDLYLSDDLKDSIKLLSQKENFKISTIFIAAFNVLSQRYSSQESIIFEQSLIVEQEINNNDNKLKVKNFKIEVNSNIRFIDFLNIQQKALDEAINFTNVNIAGISGATEDNEKTELFKTLFIIQDDPNANQMAQHMRINDIANQLLVQFDLFHLGLFLKENNSFPEVHMFHNPDVVKENLPETFKQHLINLLTAITVKPTAEIGSYNILTKTEFNQIVKKFNNTIVSYNKEQTIHGLFEDQVLRTPDSVALLKGLNYITYDELNKKANRLARHLINNGLKPEDKVGLVVTRDFNMITGMLAIMKAGGTYVPIDHDYPVERQHFIFNHSESKMILADDDYQLRTMIDESSYIRIDSNEYNKLDNTNPGLQISSKQLAYIIYTSGSTGQPKGVMIEHHSVINLVAWVNTKFNIGSDDRLLFITSMCFDLSVYDIFGMLGAGGTLVIAEKKEIQSVKVLQDMMLKYNITFWDSVPTTLDYLVKNLEIERSDYRYDGLKTVFMSGDWIPNDLPDRIKTFFPKTEVVSLGGATEGTVWSNYYIVKETSKTWNSIPYGKPIDNNFFYILNEHLQPVPVGVTGDLYIGGVGVARGYANDPVKSAASFVPDPFIKEAGGMMYKTGDLGRMMPDFNMEFIGRKDNQVKINGFRIELGEIENTLKSYELIANAVVLAKNDQDDKKRLISYFIRNGSEFDQDKMISYLKQKLPNYMIPAIWVELETLPLTNNGKIDRKALANFDDSALLKKRSAEQPGTSTEKIIFDIWKDTLKLKVSGINDNFFELGGHSLMAVQMLSKFKKLTGKTFQLAVLYQYPDIQSLAQFIDKEQANSEFKYLVPIKAKGTKDPLYIVQGDSGNILNFSNLIKYIDKEQPLYGLKAIGLDGVHAPFENLDDIARLYIDEIIKHNPKGPYLIAGYSSGAYVAVEIRKQLKQMGKQVKHLLIIDADAGMTEYKKKYMLIPKKIKRHYPEFITYIKSSLFQAPAYNVEAENMATPESKPSLLKYFSHKNSEASKEAKEIKYKRERAFKNYKIEPFDDQIYLLKAKISVHYIDYGKYLGWEQYATQGVKLHEVPGDHFSILLPPYVEEFTTTLQKNLNEA